MGITQAWEVRVTCLVNGEKTVPPPVMVRTYADEGEAEACAIAVKHIKNRAYLRNELTPVDATVTNVRVVGVTRCACVKCCALSKPCDCETRVTPEHLALVRAHVKEQRGSGRPPPMPPTVAEAGKRSSSRKKGGKRK